MEPFVSDVGPVTSARQLRASSFLRDVRVWEEISKPVSKLDRVAFN